jgi:hypothetical protein
MLPTINHLFESGADFYKRLKLEGGRLPPNTSELFDKNDMMSFDFSHQPLTTLKNCPLDIKLHFDVSNNRLKNLIHGPTSVGGIYDVSSNKLTSLEGAPEIATSFNCTGNSRLAILKFAPMITHRDFFATKTAITSLEFAPKTVGGRLMCQFCKITDLHDVQKHISKVGKDLVLYGNNITSSVLGLMLIDVHGSICTNNANPTIDEILNKWKNQGRKGVLGAQRELLDAGYEELAQL